jgi:flavin-binding protein dodecin
MIAEKYVKRAGRVADELRVSEVVDARRTLVTGRVI